MKNLVSYLFVQFVFLILAVSVCAQNPSPTPPVDDTSKTFEVRLPVTVMDKKKNLVFCSDNNKDRKENKDKKKEVVQCFSKDDFIVLEDGVPQDITFFTDEKTNPPVYVGVLMDTSPSTAGKMTFSKRAASDFLYTVVRLRKDKGAFMTFDNEVNLIQDFTDKLDLLDKAVDRVKKVGSQTALYDAIYQFTEEKLRSAPGRRVIVVITDGDDTFSRADLNDAIDIAQRTETTIFGISTKEAFLGAVPGVEAGTVKDRGDKYLTRLCEETGGEAFFSGDMGALERAFTNISRELQSQYIITYRPANQSYDGRKRKIEVVFKNKENADKFRIRSKSEYRSVRDSLR
jgi:Ca-activated chloride channel family protein